MKVKGIHHNLGDILRKHRIKLDYSQHYIGYMLDINQNAYCAIENGKSDVNLSRLYRLAEILLTTVPEILSELEIQPYNKGLPS